MMESLALHQCVFAAAEFGIADLLACGQQSINELAAKLNVEEDSLYRVLRLLASQGVFTETALRTFANTDLSNFLRSDVPGSLRSMGRFRGTEFVYQSFGEILHTIRTGEPGRAKVLGMDGWEYLERNPGTARIFDDAMTDISAVVAPVIAVAYDFSKWETLMDVGGGNGVLLAAVLRAHRSLRGVLADQQHVLKRARERGFLSGALEKRSSMQPCDLFRDIPKGCRAYLMKSVIHDWNDDDAHKILTQCRRAVPKNGALLLVEFNLPEDNSQSRAKFVDINMMVLTGGKERTIPEYSSLLNRAGFRLNEVVKTPSDFNVMEALPV
jgi:hypothetical protein